MKFCRNSLLTSLGVVTLAAAWGLAAPDVDAIRKKIVAVDPRSEEPRVEMTYLQASGSVNLKTGKVARTLSLRGYVHLPPGTDVVGVSHQLALTRVQDEQDRDMLPQILAGGQLTNRRYYSTVHRRLGQGASPSIYVSASLNGLRSLPKSFKQLGGRAYIRLAKKRLTHEVKPVRAGGLIDLTNGFVLQIKQVTRASGRLKIVFSYEADQANPFFNVNMKPPFVSAVELVDDKEHVLSRGSWSNGSSRSDEGVVKGTATVQFTLAADRQPAVLKLEVVTEIEDRAVDFQIKDVKIPIHPDDQAKG